MPNKVEDLQPEKRIVAMFVSRSGAGKTSAAASFPKPMRVLDFDGRIRGILGCPWLDKKGIEYEYYPPRTKLGENTYQRVNKDMETLATQAQIGQLNLQTLVLDSLTAETFALVCDAIPLTHKNNQGAAKGKSLGTLAMPGPEDYGFEAQGTYQLLAFLRSLPIPNIIVTAHIVDRYGKSNPADSYSESIIIGEELSIRKKIAENVLIYFDHVIRFEKKMAGDKPRHVVKFHSDLARTTFSGLPFGEVDITGKHFYDYLIANKGN